MTNSQSVLSVDNLSKRYAIGGRDELNKSFREMIMSTLSAPFRRYKTLSGQVKNDELFWALKDINFQVNQGEVVGIIGKNGAGKSTLLKILSRITTPTEGSVTLKGNVASLLEVGTGFHPELTGRENIYLNGAILGMRKNEIKAKFDKIVEFANIEKFVDTPVKRYSSGMYVRLAFSIAAHLDPDILIVDEVLAVGDVQFQKRCLGKLNDIATTGRTVLFVSHNMSSINRLCSRAILLENGKIIEDSGVQEVIEQYLRSDQNYTDGVWQAEPGSQHNLPIEFTKISICNERQQISNVVPYNESFSIKLSAISRVDAGDYIFGILVTDIYGNQIFVSHHYDKNLLTIKIKQNKQINLQCNFPNELLRPGKYTLSVFYHERIGNALKAICENQLNLHIADVGFNVNPGRKGIVVPKLTWQITD